MKINGKMSIKWQRETTNADALLIHLITSLCDLISTYEHERLPLAEVIWSFSTTSKKEMKTKEK